MSAEIEQLVLQLHDIGAIKFGSFKLKTGITSPIYFDLRVMVSFPKVLKRAVKIIWKKLCANNVVDDFVCGVPYTALPIASILSAEHDVRS
jgi:uridine monophosphate synthetase